MDSRAGVQPVSSATDAQTVDPGMVTGTGAGRNTGDVTGSIPAVRVGPDAEPGTGTGGVANAGADTGTGAGADAGGAGAGAGADAGAGSKAEGAGGITPHRQGDVLGLLNQCAESKDFDVHSRHLCQTCEVSQGSTRHLFGLLCLMHACTSCRST